MKYSVEMDRNGYVETLEVNGKKYIKTWKRTDAGTLCEDAEFWEQLETDGVSDEEVLDMICDEIDNVFFASNVYDVFELIGERR